MNRGVTLLYVIAVGKHSDEVWQKPMPEGEKNFPQKT